MVNIILLRPGSTDYNQQGRIQGNLDVPLNEAGNAEVAWMIEGLRELAPEALYSPTSQPSLETAEAIAGALEIKVKKLDNMQNLDHGLWQGMLIEEVKRKHPKVYRQWQETPQNVRPPEGEMLEEAEARLVTVMSKLLKRHKNGLICLVVPEPLASLVRRFCNDEELGDLWKASTEQHGAWEILQVQSQALAHSG